VITTATSAKRGGDDNPTTVDLVGNQNLIEAAKAAGVKQFIFVSANIADPTSPIPLMQAKGITEDNLRASGVPYTIIAPDAFMEVWIAIVVGAPVLAGQPVTFIGTGTRKHSFISAVDVAKFIIASIDNPEAINQKLIIGGPKPLSFREAAAIFEQVAGRKIPVQSVAPGQPVPGFPDAMAQFIGGFDSYDSPIEMANISKTFGVKLTSIEEFAKAFMASSKS
jgi:NADH dehydrogenase